MDETDLEVAQDRPLDCIRIIDVGHKEEEESVLPGISKLKPGKSSTFQSDNADICCPAILLAWRLYIVVYLLLLIMGIYNNPSPFSLPPLELLPLKLGKQYECLIEPLRTGLPGRTALQIDAKHWYPEMIELLLDEGGAEIDQADEGKTALHVAVENG
ncbi:hypothetical protein B0O99DRAFT_692149 [Bisporella sp. PMI_857]|nr:hypothetical protein B0O99DRAFT_692149 [Bisporella sp. PMI_857]